MPSQALANQGDTALEPYPEYARYAADALKAAWGKNYEKAPDVGGMYWDNANKRMYVLLVDGGSEERKQEIIALVGNADWVGFENCKYSYTQLKAVMDDISAAREANRDGNVPAYGVDERGNCVKVSVLKEAMETVGQRYKDCYGDMVHVEEGQPIPKTDGKGHVLGMPKTGDAVGFGYLQALLLSCLCLRLRKRAGG